MLIEEIIGAFTGANRRRQCHRITLGTTLGFLGGATLALLLAPRSGKETRKLICDYADQGVVFAKDAAGYGYEKACCIADKAQAALSDFSSDIEGQFDDVSGTVGRAADRNVRRAARAARKVARKARRAAFHGALSLAERLALDEEPCECLEGEICECVEATGSCGCHDDADKSSCECVEGEVCECVEATGSCGCHDDLTVEIYESKPENKE